MKVGNHEIWSKFLAKIALMCVFTVATLANSVAAISALLRPSATRASTSASRRVSDRKRARRSPAASGPAGAAAVREPTMRAPTSGAKVDWPLATALIAANLCWVIAYDTYYAMADRADDLKIGVKSSAILFGRYDRLITAALQLLSLALLAGIGLHTGRGAFYYAGLAVALLCAVYEQWLIRARDPAASFRAFLHSHYIGLAILVGLAADLAR